MNSPIKKIENIVPKKWDEASALLKAKWSELTDDDIGYIAGSTERLSKKLKEKYQDKKRDIQKEIDTFIESI